jgi:glutamyl-tRNA reductase
MNVVVIGLNHKTAPLHLRERLSYRAEELGDSLKELRAIPSVSEALILSTCNRVEFYSVTDSVEEMSSRVEEYLSQSRKVSQGDFAPYLYRLLGREAVCHAFRVASSLDSMVVGEPQILGQVKEAYHAATSAHATGVILNRLIHHAFSVAKRVRTETGVAKEGVSIGSAAVDLAEKIFGGMKDRIVLVVGAGEMCKAAVRQFKNRGVSQLNIVNRTLDRAVELAERFQGTPLPWDQLEKVLHEADIVITSTGAFEPIFSASLIHRVMKERRWRPMFFIDIAVPRNVAPDVHQLENVYLYNIDDLEGVVRENRKERMKEAEQGEQMILEEADRFEAWFQGLEAVPTIVSLNEKLERIREQELRKCVAALKNGAKDPMAEAERMSHAIINKILHEPLDELKRASHGPERYLYIEAVRRLFGLGTEEKK